MNTLMCIDMFLSDKRAASGLYLAAETGRFRSCIGHGLCNAIRCTTDASYLRDSVTPWLGSAS